MFSDTGRKEAAILVRCFLCFLVRRVPAYMVSCFVVFEDLTPLFAQLPLPKNKIVFQEQKKFDGVIKVNYDVKNKKGEGYLVAATSSTAILLTNDGFLSVNSDDKIKSFKPARTNVIRQDLQTSFSDISIDSFRNLIKGKAINELKIQSALSLSFSKDNEPQSSTTVNLSYVFNPVFLSKDVDSINSDVEREISLTKIQLEEIQNANKIFEDKKNRIFNELTAARKNLSNPDLAIKEKAVKELPQIEKSYASLQQPAETTEPILIRLSYLNQKLHIRKTQKISGFISFIIFK